MLPSWVYTPEKCLHAYTTGFIAALPETILNWKQPIYLSTGEWNFYMIVCSQYGTLNNREMRALQLQG